jgi:phenylalanyl-tRNA synthetase beta subunit
MKNRGAKVFEIGKVFPTTGEELHVAWIDEKGNAHEETLNPSSSSSYTLLEKVSQFKPFTPWSSFPYITRDIAVWTPEGADPKILESLYKEESGDLLVREPILVDTFSKEGRTSYAYRLVFQSYERTLMDDDVAPITESITAKLTELGYEVR